MSAHYLSIGTKLNGGRYVVQQYLGQGGSSLLYRVEDTQEKRTALLKECFLRGCDRASRAVSIGFYVSTQTFQAAKQRFHKEAEILRELKDIPGVVEFYDSFEANNTVYLVLENIEGESLRQRLARSSTGLSIYETMQYGHQLGEILTAVHGKGVLHRDIKPSNIVRGCDGKLKLVDFGNATSEASGSEPLTGATCGYTAPELYDTDTEPNVRTEVYALGATLYALLSGAPPPDAKDRLLGRAEIKNLTSVHPTIPARFSRAIQLALDLDSNNRPANVLVLMNLLESALQPEAEAFTRVNGKTAETGLGTPQPTKSALKQSLTSLLSLH